jgi:hypothetical protein
MAKKQLEINGRYFKVLDSIAKRKDLSLGARLLHGKLLALSNEKGVCWARNSYLSDFFSTDVRTISRWLKEIKDKKLIDISKEYEAGRVKKRYIIVYEKPYGEPVKNN